MPVPLRSVTAALCALCVAACRPSPAPQADPQALIAEARSISQRDGPRAAVPRFDAILARARQTNDRRTEALVLGHLGTAHKNLGEYDRALDFHRQSLALKRSLADRAEEGKTLNNIGLVYWSRGDCTQALRHYDDSLATFEALKMTGLSASVINNQGLCLDTLGRYRDSRLAYQRALALHRTHGNELGESEALANLGGVQLLLGRFADAVTAYSDALAIDSRLESQQGIVVDRINLATAAMGLGSPAAALDHLHRARDLAQRAGLAKEEGDAHRGVGRALATLGKYDEARAAIEAALKIYDKAALTTERVDALQDRGHLDLDLGGLASAAAAFSEAATVAQSSRYASGLAGSLIALGRLEQRRGRSEDARKQYLAAQWRAEEAGDLAGTARAATYLAALELGGRRSEDVSVHLARALDAARAGGARLIEAEALLIQADMHLRGRRLDAALASYDQIAAIAGEAADPQLQWRAAYGRGRALETKGDRDTAVSRYLEAVRIIEQVRGRLAASRNRAGFLDDKGHVYTALVSLLIRLGRVDEAFDVAERLRSAGFLDLLARSVLLGGFPQGGVAVGLLSRIEHLQRAIASDAEQATGDRRSSRATFRDELREAERAWLDAVDTLARTNPAVAQLRQRAPLAVVHLQRQLPPRTALVQYVVAETETVAFVMTTTSLRAQSLPTTRNALAARIELVRGLIARQQGDQWREPAARLGADLLTPLEAAGWLEGIDRLVIVPHAELNYLPFAALIRNRRDGPRLLVDDYALSFLPAASLLVPARRTGATEGELLAMAPQPGRLPHSVREVEEVAALFAGQPRLLIGQDATEQSFKVEARRHAVVHVATHGFYDRFNPLFSGLELGRAGTDDGRLQVFEILGLQLHARLVTLSACETALGTGELTDVPTGEEFVGLTRAFLSAGAGSVLASLWDISDGATPALMRSFYATTKRQRLSDALAGAQRQRAHGGGRQSHPFFWAPFVLVGAAANVDVGSVNSGRR